MVSFSALRDPFTGAGPDPAVWTQINRGTCVGAQVGGVYRFTLAPSTVAYSELQTATVYDLTGAQAQTEIVSAGDQTIPSLEVYPVGLYSGPDALFVVISAGVLGCYHIIGGAQTGLAYETYAQATHRYIRIRESAGTVFWERSSDGMVWAVMFAEPTPVDVTAMTMSLQAGEWAGGEGDAAVVEFDNVNIVEVATVPGGAAPAGVAAGPVWARLLDAAPAAGCPAGLPAEAVWGRVVSAAPAVPAPAGAAAVVVSHGTASGSLHATVTARTLSAAVAVT